MSKSVRTTASSPGLGSTWATSSSMATTSTATASTSPRGWRHWQSRAASASREWVRDQIRDKLPYPFEDMGEQNVKNIARPVRAYAMSASAVASTPLVAAEAQPRPARRSLSPQRVVIAASTVAVIAMGIAAWWAWPNRDSPTVSIQAPSATGPQSVPTLASTPAPRLSIVVLPFVNLSNDPEQDYFADGITDDLTTDLSRISDSFVIARNTAFTYKGKSVDMKEIGRDLGVRYALEGSVRRTGEQV